MYLVLIIAALLILIIGMFLGMKSMKPLHFNFIAGLIIVVGTFFGLFGRQLQDKISGEKSDNILKNTSDLQDQLAKLNQDIVEKNKEIVQLSETNIELGKKNSELSIRLSEKAIDIHDLNKKIKYPLPDFVEVSYMVIFKLDEESQIKADIILGNYSSLFKIMKGCMWVLTGNYLVVLLIGTLFQMR
jgi:regulator of replication initiation timing